MNHCHDNITPYHNKAWCMIYHDSSASQHSVPPFCGPWRWRDNTSSWYLEDSFKSLNPQHSIDLAMQPLAEAGQSVFVTLTRHVEFVTFWRHIDLVTFWGHIAFVMSDDYSLYVCVCLCVFVCVYVCLCVLVCAYVYVWECVRWLRTLWRRVAAIGGTTSVRGIHMT